MTNNRKGLHSNNPTEDHCVVQLNLALAPPWNNHLFLGFMFVLECFKMFFKELTVQLTVFSSFLFSAQKFIQLNEYLQTD